MTPPPAAGTSRWRGLGLALALGLGLLLISYSRRIGDLNSAIFHDEVINTLLETPLWATALMRNVLLFALALLALHLLFGLACWLLALLAERAWPRAGVTRRQWVCLWSLGLATVLLVRNAAEFPGSSLGSPYATLARTGIAGIGVGTLAGGIAAAAIVATLLRAALRTRTWAPRLPLAAGVVGALSLATLATWPQAAARPGHAPAAAHGRPNVIIVGIDSLRDDLIAADGTSRHGPNVGRFLAGATRFADTTTPLARTFPSWVAILTGEHPHTTGATINLLPRASVDVRDALGFLLRRAGYRTVYAIDETRFSNIDASYGFDQTITPPIGATDFLLSWFGDTPLSNSIVNTTAGRWLLPNVHANRAAAVTYDPDSFVRRVDRELEPGTQPLLLAAHLTLAHWPYSWQSGVGPTADDAAALRTAYLAAIERVDQQFASLMAVLERKGLLANSIVVVLSDHGESFDPGTDSIGPGNIDALRALEAVPGWGHGTSVLAPDQFRVVLGVRLPGATGNGATLAVPVSLEDLSPTLLELLRLPAPARADGWSLASLLRDPGAPASRFAGRIRYTESEFTPKALAHAAAQASTSGVAMASVYYHIDPVTDRLQLRSQYVARLNANRQFAALTDDDLVAALPDPGVDRYVYLHVPEPFQQGSLVSSLTDGDGGRDAPAIARLRGALHQRFGAILDARGGPGVDAPRAAPPQS